MLVGFPITFLVSAFFCDVVGRVLEDERWWTIGAYMALAGIASALVAAVPGLIDYFWAVPPGSSGKRRATYHMLVNGGAVALFVGAWSLRQRPSEPPGWPVLLMEGLGLVLLTMGGWLGGTLVYRNFIGPEHRHANAGKWKQERIDAEPGKPVVVADESELAMDQMKLLHVNGQRIVLAHTAQGYAAFQDHCPHRGGSLADGVLICGKVQCLWHGSRFDVHTGAVETGPADKPITRYPLQVRGGKIWLTV